VTVEVFDKTPDAGEAARQVMEEIVLVAIIDADIGTEWPYQDTIDSTITPIDVVQIPVDGVVASCRIVKESVVHHHLWLHKARSRPGKLWPRA
jgi:hypothetical protein